MSLAWMPVAILLIPLGLAVLTALMPRARANLAHSLAAAGMAVATGISGWLAMRLIPADLKIQGAHAVWLDAGGFALGVGVFADPLAAVMAVLVCLLATFVLVYNSWYMEGDALAARFPWQFCFFVFAMLGVVLSDNLFMSFVCWELVGLGSYLLIGFWFAKPAVADDPDYQRLKGAGARGVLEDRLSPAHAQLKAFVMNRIGDAGFLVGIGALLAAGAAGGGVHEPLTWGNLELLALDGTLPGTFLGLSGGNLLTLAALGIFCGAVGKSAQFPLHTWLPDAMQGPTTASSIIHAATMVAAGVYLVARCYPLFTPDALTVVGLIGGITCLLAATIACVQWDLKAVLAYSTVSQLGLMFVGLGAGSDAGGPGAGMGHLFTHALFKCLLFLCAGAIIHAVNGCQDLARLGGLWKRMPVTALASLLAVLSIIGTPFFSGFYTKDTVLAAALLHAQAAGGVAWAPFLLACAGSLLTAVYMLRWWIRIFLGPARDHVTQHAHDPSWCATLVLIAMAPLTILMPPGLSHWLERGPDLGIAGAHGHAVLIGGGLLVASLAFAALAYWRLPGPLTHARKPGWWTRLFPGHRHDCGTPGVPHICQIWCGKIVVVALAPFTLLIPWALGFVLDHSLEPAHSELVEKAHYHAMLIAVGLFSTGSVIAFTVYWWMPWLGGDAGGFLRQRLRLLHLACAELWGIDRLWNLLFVRGLGAGLGRLSARCDLGSRERLASLEGTTTEADRNELSLDGAIDGIGHTCAGIGRAGAVLHGGRLGVYLAAAAAIAGAALLLGLLA